MGRLVWSAWYGKARANRAGQAIGIRFEVSLSPRHLGRGRRCGDRATCAREALRSFLPTGVGSQDDVVEWGRCKLSSAPLSRGAASGSALAPVSSCTKHVPDNCRNTDPGHGSPQPGIRSEADIPGRCAPQRFFRGMARDRCAFAPHPKRGNP